MHMTRAAALLLLLTAGCASVTPDQPVSQPEDIATQADPPQSAAPPQPAAPPAATTRAPIVPAPRPGAPAVAAPPAPAASPTLDLDALKERLKGTKAIGLFTKIALKNQVDDLLDEFRALYQGKARRTLTDLRRSYNLLIMKVLSLLQDEDQKLASDIVSSREAIWALLADPTTFATLQS